MLVFAATVYINPDGTRPISGLWSVYGEAGAVVLGAVAFVASAWLVGTVVARRCRPKPVPYDWD